MNHAFAQSLVVLADVDIGKLIAVAIPILIGLGSWAIGQLQKNAQAQRRVPPRPGPAQPRPVAPSPADEVEEFLRRVSQRREQPAAKVEAARPAPAAKPVAPPPAEKPSKRRGKQARTSVAEHVEQTLDAKKKFSGHKTNVDSADEAMQQHVKSVFEHRIGQFQTETLTDDTQSASAEAAGAAIPIVVTPARELAALLQTPQGMRQAILLGEVLRRPTHRWE